MSSPPGSTPLGPHRVWHLLATAQVTPARRPSGADFRFGTSRVPPQASAAASATDGVPTARAGAADGFGTAIRVNSPAGYPRTGTPSRAAAATIAGRPAAVATVASSTTDSGGRPASRSVAAISASTSAVDAPLLAPTPTISSPMISSPAPSAPRS